MKHNIAVALLLAVAFLFACNVDLLQQIDSDILANTEYKLTVKSSPGCTVQPAGIVSVLHGKETSINASIADGYIFSAWEVESGESIHLGDPSQAQTSIKLEGGDATIQALAQKKVYTLSIQSGDMSKGTVTPQGNIEAAHGTALDIRAAALENGSFVNWTKVGGIGTVEFANANADTTTVTVTGGDASIQANFSTKSYTLTISAGSGGTVNPAGNVPVDHDEQTQIQALPNSGYHFINWIKVSGTGQASFADPDSSETSVSVSGGNVTIQAVFEINTYTLTIQAGSGGTVNPSGIYQVTHGAAFSISASPEASTNFITWTKVDGTGIAEFANAGAATTTVRLTGGDATIQANFSTKSYVLTVGATAGGTVLPSGAIAVDHGEAIDISATPASGYNFSGWVKQTGSGTVTFDNPAAAQTTVSLTGGNATIQATFTLKQYSLTIQPGSGGTVNPSGNHQVEHGVPFNISATASVSHNFSEWVKISGSGSATFANSSNASTSVTLTGGNATIQANFTYKQYTLNIAAGTGGSVNPSGDKIVNYGVYTDISATPATGYNFVNWEKISGTGNVNFENSTLASTRVSVTEGNANIRANFALKQYSLTVSKSGAGTTSPSGTQTVHHGASTALSASPDFAQVFKQWSVISGSGVSIGSTTSTSTTATLTNGNAEIRASFEEHHGYLTIPGATNASTASNTAVGGNNVFVVYYDSSAKDLMYTRSLDRGLNWTTPLAIDSTGDVGKYCHMQLRVINSIPTSYRIEVAYYDTTNARLKYVEFEPAATSFAPIVVDSGGVGEYCRLVVNHLNVSTNPNIGRVIVYYDNTNSRLKIAKKYNSGSWVIETVDQASGTNIGKFCDITAIPLTDDFYLSYVYNGTYVGRAFTTAISWSATSTWSKYYYNAGATVTHTGIAINSSAYGAICYSASDQLKVLRTSNGFSSVTNSTIDTSTGAGKDSKIYYLDNAFWISYIRQYTSGSTTWRGVYYQKSTDNGVSWAKNTISSWTGTGGYYNCPSMASDGSYLYVSYGDHGGLMGTPVYLIQAKSLDGGATW